MAKKTTNADAFNAVRAEMPVELQNIIPEVDKLSGDAGEVMFDLFASYPTAKNAWIDTLTQKVSKSILYDRVFSNPFRVLHKGTLSHGSTIEQMFVKMAKKRGWYENFANTNGSPENDLIGMEIPDIAVDYISQNFKYKYKTTVSDIQLRDAFTNENGVNSLISHIVASLENSVQYQEYLDTLKMITNAVADTTGGSTIGTGLVQKYYAGANKANVFIPVGATIDAKKLTKAIKKIQKDWKFPSDKFNNKGVLTHCPASEIVILMTTEMAVEIDVELLASQFHMSKAEIQGSIIEVPSLGQTKATGGQDVLAIVADKEAFQFWTQLMTNNSFYNPDKLSTNLFAHHWGLVGACEFANMAVLVKGDTIS